MYLNPPLPTVCRVRGGIGVDGVRGGVGVDGVAEVTTITWHVASSWTETHESPRPLPLRGRLLKLAASPLLWGPTCSSATPLIPPRRRASAMPLNAAACMEGGGGLAGLDWGLGCLRLIQRGGGEYEVWG